MYSFEDTGAPPKGWPRFPNDVIAQSIPDYAAIVEAIRDATRPRFVEFGTTIINPAYVEHVYPEKDGKHCVVCLSYGAEIGVTGTLLEVLAKLRGAQ